MRESPAKRSAPSGRSEPPTPPDRAGEIAARVDVSRDERLHHSATLATLGDMTGEIAHEVSNVLHTVKGYSELALRDPNNAANVRLALETTVERVRYLEGRTRYLSRLGDTRPREREEASLAALAAEAVEVLGKIGRLTHCTLRLLGPAEGAWIRCDPRQIHQLLANLLSNAADATDGRGAIEVEVRELEESGLVELKVSDNGVGIPEELLDRVFEPFFSTKAPGRGTGLGLGIVQRIAAAHGGRLVVDSVSGRGSRFSVLFPRAPLPSESR
jgi:signal transduction histidine kinase